MPAAGVREPFAMRTGIRPTGVGKTCTASLGELMDDGDFLAAGRMIEHVQRVVQDRRPLSCSSISADMCRAAGLSWQGAALAASDGARADGRTRPQRKFVGAARCHERIAKATFRAFDPSIDLGHRRPSLAPRATPPAWRHTWPANSRVSRGRCVGSARSHRRTGRLLAKVRRQVIGAKRGVFPWNYESYDDVDLPPPGFDSPLKPFTAWRRGSSPIASSRRTATTAIREWFSSITAVRAPRRFASDYSRNGTASIFLPSCGRRSAKCPPPDTYFWLWADLSPEQVAMSDLEQLWTVETDRWGGAEAFQKHWRMLQVAAPRVRALRPCGRSPAGAGAAQERARRRHLVEQRVLHDLQQLAF